MASSYSTDLKIELMVTGENAGTWGDKTNDNLDVIEQAIAGFKQVSIAGGAQTTNLLINNSPDIATSDARNAVIKLSGTITGNQIVTVPTGITKTYIVQNGTTGAFTVQFIQAGGTGTTFSTTDKGIKILFADGTNINAVDLSTLSGTIATAQIADLAITSSKLASFAVTSARLASFAVTTSRLATNAVTAIKITQSTITQSKLAANSVGSNQLISTGVTAASYTSASITVDADGRITSASSGAAGGGAFVPTQWFTSGSGTYTANPATSAIACIVFGGGGGGGGGTMNAGSSGGTGGQGGFGYFNKNALSSPFAQPYAIGSAGNGGGAGSNNASGGAGNAGGVTNFTNVASANAGNGGSGGSRNGGMSSAGNNGTAPTANFNPPNRTFLISDTYGNGGPGGVGGPCNPINAGSVGQAGAIVIFENIGK